jgi:hypothetical protein
VLTNFHVHDNTTTVQGIADGRTGIVGEAIAFAAASNNRYAGNIYYLGSNANYFTWQNTINETQWQGYSQDVNGRFYRGISMACDLSADSRFSVVDVQQAVNQVLGISSSVNCDVNQDGRCSILDIQRIVMAVLSGVCNGD